MSNSEGLIPIQPTVPLPNKEVLMYVLSSPVRWTILRELSLGEPLVCGDIAAITGMKSSSISKQFNQLVAAGIVEQGRGRSYKLVKPYRPAPGAPKVLDFGHCVLRFDLDATP